MANFPDVFQKMMLATNGIVETADTPTIALTAGQLAVVDPRTYKSVAVGAGTTAQTVPSILLVQGSMSAADNLGGVATQSVGGAGGNPFHGGYKESIKSRVIDPRFIDRFYFVGATDQTYAAVNLTIVGSAAQFELNQSINGGPHTPNPANIAQDGALRRQEVYRLRLDLKGSPVLRLLDRNMFYWFDATTKCMADGSIDRAALVTQWKEAINTHPIISKLVTASNVSPLVLVVTDTYRDTVFQDVSYSRRDFHEREGIQIFMSVADERQVTCNATLFTSADVSVGKQGTGFGETILQELILENEYQGNPFQYDVRMREVLNDTNLTSIDRTRKYGAYHIIYRVPRKGNGSSQLDTDRILIKIPTASVAATGQVGTRNAAFEAFIPAYAASAGNSVPFENLTSVIGAA